jgi:hypothetical protein
MAQRLLGITLVFRLAAAVCGVFIAAQVGAQTTLPSGSQLFVLETGTVSAQFIGGASALFDNELHLDAPAAVSAIFQNHSSTPGAIVGLGPFSAGAELVFRDRVTDASSAITDYRIGPGARNPDGVPHALITRFTNAEVTLFEGFLGLAPGTLIRGAGTNPVFLVGFEDIFGLGGSPDFNDMRFLVNNVTAVPEPSQALLLFAGLGVIAWVVKRRGRAALM